MANLSLSEALASLPSLLHLATADELAQVERDLCWISPAAVLVVNYSQSESADSKASDSGQVR